MLERLATLTPDRQPRFARLDLPQVSYFALHLLAGIVGETDRPLPRTAPWAAAEGGRDAILDKGRPLAKVAAMRCKAWCDLARESRYIGSPYARKRALAIRRNQERCFT
jgi:hypothetical protein